MFNIFSSVKNTIFAILFLIAFLHFSSFIPTFYSLISNYKEANLIIFLNDVGDELYTAVGNYGFERGRVNVVLNDAGPVEKMEENRSFILARRAEGDKALKNAIAKLAEFNQGNIKNEIIKITQLADKIENLRKETAKDLLIPKSQRKLGLAESWFTAMTAYIESIESLLVDISGYISDADGVIGRYSFLKHETMALRNVTGPEMSILSATMLSNSPLSPSLEQKIKNLQIEIQSHFQRLDYLGQSLSNSQIPNALKELKKSYYDDYVPYREIVFPLALRGGPYPYSQPEFLNRGVQALQQITALMENIVAVTKNYAQNRLAEIRKNIILQVFSSFGSLLLIILVFVFANYRVFQPIDQVTSAILRLGQKDLDLLIPYQNAQNEIGEMSRAVEIFKGMAIQLDQDVVALEKASVERELLISKLQETLTEIKVLRGILPICSYCKQIRNDNGYYEQLESYIHKHSGVDFSHTICPSCAQKHYPEVYSSMKKNQK